MLRLRLIAPMLAIMALAWQLPPASASDAVTLTHLTSQFHFSLSDGREGFLASIVPLGRSANLNAALTLPAGWRDAPLRLEQAGSDRYGQGQFWVYLQADNRLLQEDLVRQELAMPYSHHGALPPDLAAMPIAAKATISADEAEEFIGSWAQVHGRITDVSVQKTAAYLNFGADWKSDFTIHLPKATLKHFGAETLNALKGKHVKVRGFVHRYAGARITLLEPSMLEVLQGEPH